MANLQRSPTGENIFAGSENYEAKSAGIHPNAFQTVTKKLVEWADIIFVFSEKVEGHKSFLLEKFKDLDPKKIIDLDIQDMYDKNDPELIKLLKRKLQNYLHDTF